MPLEHPFEENDLMDSKHPNLDNPFNQKFGHPTERAAAKVKDALPDLVKDFIRQAPFVVLSTSDAQGHCDASPKGGKPGFVKILDDTHLLIPDIAGNRLFQSYQNMLDNPHVGIVFFIPGCPDVARVNGTVTILSGDEVKRREIEAAVNNPDDRTVVLQGVLIDVEEAYGHCPRAINFADLWDIEQIERNGTVQRIVNPGNRLERANPLLARP
jgi:PPOX class probable FMN-dependent enzyme